MPVGFPPDVTPVDSASAAKLVKGDVTLGLGKAKDQSSGDRDSEQNIVAFLLDLSNYINTSIRGQQAKIADDKASWDQEKAGLWNKVAALESKLQAIIAACDATHLNPADCDNPPGADAIRQSINDLTDQIAQIDQKWQWAITADQKILTNFQTDILAVQKKYRIHNNKLTFVKTFISIIAQYNPPGCSGAAGSPLSLR